VTGVEDGKEPDKACHRHSEGAPHDFCADSGVCSDCDLRWHGVSQFLVGGDELLIQIIIFIRVLRGKFLRIEA